MLMIETIGNKLYGDRVREKVAHLMPFIPRASRVLDFGSGDLTMLSQLKKRHPSLDASGVDVVDFGKRHSGIRFKQIRKDAIPYINSSFDIVISYFVFHHTTKPEDWFSECIRVTRKRIIFVEPIWRHEAELPFMCAWDTICNRWKSHDVPLPFSFRSHTWWKQQITQHNLKLVALRDVEPMPAFFPIGRAKMFVADKIS